MTVNESVRKPAEIQEYKLEEFTKRLKSDLRIDIVEVYFTKADGTLREMRCTLNPKFIHTNLDVFTKPRSTGRAKIPNDNNLSVWDLQANNWRSFRLKSIKRVHRMLTGGCYCLFDEEKDTK